jgi:glutathione S-transferase
MIKLYGLPRSRSTRITWLLEELGLDYEYIALSPDKNGLKSPEYLAINPGGKVPTLVEGGVTLTESGAITAYLADKYSDNGLIPGAGTRERALYDRWSYFALCELEQPLWTIGKHTFALREDKRVPAVIPTAQWEFQHALKLLSEGLGDKPYILGDDFQAVDILLGHTLFWAMAFKQDIPQENLKAYAQRLQGREALQRASSREEATGKA